MLLCVKMFSPCFIFIQSLVDGCLASPDFWIHTIVKRLERTEN